MKKNKKRYASVKDYDIKKLLFPNKKYRYLFPNKDTAIKQLDNFRKKYIVSREEEVEPVIDELKFWIRGLINNNPSPAREGLPKGEYICVNIFKDQKKKYFEFRYEILDVSPSQHPQRRQVIKTNPNWGFPILRDFKKGKIYTSLEKPCHEFSRLEEYFPSSAKRGDVNTLYLSIAEKIEDKLSFIKYIFKIVELDNQKFKVEFELNKFQKKKFIRQKFNIFNSDIFSVMKI